ncbi:MAG: hypothetical protein ACK50P_08215 [Planctomycetaceae bacterium]
MVAPQRSKPLDKQELCRKVTALLKKAYHTSPGKHDQPVLETLLFAACFEETDADSAQAMLKRLHDLYPDLNEARVSSIGELQHVFTSDEYAPWRALRIKNLLQSTFDLNYAFELESLRRKTAELAGKHLAKIPGISWFVRGWSLQHSLGSHVLPLDVRMHGVLVWMGFAEPNSDPEQTSESLRPYIRKADAPLFCHLLKCLSLDPKRSRVFPPAGKESDCSASPDEGVHRLEVLLTRGAASVPKPAPRPAPPPTKGTKGAKGESAGSEAKPVDVAKSESARPAAKGAPTKGDAHSAPAKGPVAKPEPAKGESAKADAGRAPVPRSVAAKTPAEKAPAAKGTPEKSHTDKSHTGKSHSDNGAKPAVKAAPAKLPAGKSPAGKGGATKPAAVKTAAVKAAPVKPAPGKPAAVKSAAVKPAVKGAATAPVKGTKAVKGAVSKPDTRSNGKKRS